MKFTQKIKAFFSKVASWFKMTTEKSDELISKFAPIAVDVLQSIKTFNESNSADAVESIVESVSGKYKLGTTTVYKTVRWWIANRFPQIIDGMGIAIAVSKKSTTSEKMIAASNAIKALPYDLKSNVLSQLSADLAAYLEDGRLTIDEAIKLVKYVYDNYQNKITA